MRCTRSGCNKDYIEGNDLCRFHPGAPVFHEGLKSWSCCSEVHKPVFEFDEFMNIPGCTETDGHSSIAPQYHSSTDQGLKKPFASPSLTERFGVAPHHGVDHFDIQAKSMSVVAAPTEEGVDDLNIPVDPGTPCQRKGCGVKFVSDEVNRLGDGERTICTYHPLQPIFREGSKGYLCCKRRVLEFDEFLKIKGCKNGRHLFVPRSTERKAEELVVCRIDHYQTLDKVQVSVFAKKVDKERSTVKFEEEQVELDLYLPGSKRFTHSIRLFGPIDPGQSFSQVLSTKVELSLQKKDNRSWTVLEKTNRDLGGISLTFGVGGRTGTVGAKEVILDESNRK